MEIAPVDRFDLRFESRRWQFADDNRSAIDAHFAAKQSANPALWNGRVLLAHRYDWQMGYAAAHSWKRILPASMLGGTGANRPPGS